MKKSQKWLLVLIVLIPATLVAIFLLASGIRITELPMWVIMIPLLIIISPFTFLLAQRSGREMDDAPLQKQKKRFLTVWGFYIIFLVMLLVIAYFFSYQFFWPFLFIQVAFLLTVFFFKFRLFFPKNEESTTQNNQGN